MIRATKFFLRELMSTPSRIRANRLGKTGAGYLEVPFAEAALEKIIENYEFTTVLDVGAGEGVHAELLASKGKMVTCIDYGESVYFKKKKSPVSVIVADFCEYKFYQQYDCVWCSHVLEHQRNPGLFLEKVYSVLKEGGVLAVTVPPAKDSVVGGHVSLWSSGLLLYNLVLSGFDCSNAKVLCYGYNISVVVEKRSFQMPRLAYDSGDVRMLKKYFPEFVRRKIGEGDSFNGKIYECDWGR